MLGSTDTGKYSADSLMCELEMVTGNFRTELEVYSEKINADEYRTFLEIECKVFYNNFPKMLDLLFDIVGTSDFKDEGKIREAIFGERDRYKNRIYQEGYIFVLERGLSYVSQSNRYRDMTQGYDYYLHICDLCEHFEMRKDEIKEYLIETAQILFVKDNMLVNLTSAGEGHRKFIRNLSPYVETMKLTMSLKKRIKLEMETISEGFTYSGGMQFFARLGNYRKGGFKYSASLKVLKGILNMEGKNLWIFEITSYWSKTCI